MRKHNYDFGVEVTATDHGVRITDVRVGSPGAELGLEPGDLIEVVHGWRVRTVEMWHNSIAGQSYVRLGVRNRENGRVRIYYADLTQRNGMSGPPAA